MQKDPDFLARPFQEWSKLEPRSHDPEVLCEMIDGAPKLLSGWCQGCDTQVTNQWCTAGSSTKSLYELRHLAEDGIGILRPSELAIIEARLS